MKSEFNIFQEKIDEIYVVDDNYVNRLRRNTEIVLNIDEFEDCQTIQFTKVGYGIKDGFGNSEDGYFKLYNPDEDSSYYYFGFTFINHNGFVYLDVVIQGSDINLAKGDYFIILFEDRKKLKFKFETASKGNQYLGSNIIPITGDNLKEFVMNKIEKIKVVSSKKQLYAIYVLNEENNIDDLFKYKYTNRYEGQILLQFMTYKFIEFNLENRINV